MGNLNLVEKYGVIPQEVFSGKDIYVERQLSSAGEQSRSQEINVGDTAGAEGLIAVSPSAADYLVIKICL